MEYLSKKWRNEYWSLTENIFSTVEWRLTIEDTEIFPYKTSWSMIGLSATLLCNENTVNIVWYNLQCSGKDVILILRHKRINFILNVSSTRTISELSDSTRIIVKNTHAQNEDISVLNARSYLGHFQTVILLKNRCYTLFE